MGKQDKNTNRTVVLTDQVSTIKYSKEIELADNSLRQVLGKEIIMWKKYSTTNFELSENTVLL